MEILHIVTGERNLYIRVESGQAGKSRMMSKINKFLTEYLRARRASIKRDIEAIVWIDDMEAMRSSRMSNMRAEVSHLDYKIKKVEDITKIDDYNQLFGVTVKQGILQ